MLQNPDDMTMEIFDLLVSLKKTAYFKYDNNEINDLVTNVMWEILQGSQKLKKEFKKEVTTNFLKSIDNFQGTTFVKRIIDNYLGLHRQKRHLRLLSKLIKTAEFSKATVWQLFKEQRVVDFCVRQVLQIFYAGVRRKLLEERRIKEEASD